MAGNSANVASSRPRVTGGIAVAPLGTALPTDATTALDAAYKRGGYVTDAGVSVSYDVSVSTEQAWGGATVGSTQDSYGEEYSVSLMESLNPVTLEIVYGADNVTTTAGALTIKTNATEMPEFVMVLDMVSGSRDKRVVLPRAKISGRDEVNYSHQESTKHGISVQALPDAQGNYSYTYIAAAPTTP